MPTSIEANTPICGKFQPRSACPQGRHNGSAGVWVRRGELAGEQQSLGPRDQVVREPHDLQPDLVVLEGPERQVAQPGVLVVADVVLDAGAAAVIALELSDGRSGR